MNVILPLIQVSSFGCNLRCDYCYYHCVDQKPRFMSEFILDKLIREVINFGRDGAYFLLAWR